MVDNQVTTPAKNVKHYPLNIRNARTQWIRDLFSGEKDAADCIANGTVKVPAPATPRKSKNKVNGGDAAEEEGPKWADELLRAWFVGERGTNEELERLQSMFETNMGWKPHVSALEQAGIHAEVCEDYEEVRATDEPDFVELWEEAKKMPTYMRWPALDELISNH